MRSAIGIFAILALTLASCGEEAPTLPPKDSMAMPNFANDAGSGLTQAGTNFTSAALAVGLVTLGVRLALVTPQVIWAEVIKDKPELKDGDWLWEHNFPWLGFTATLHGKLTSGTLNTSMHITGTVNGTPLNDFVWYTGAHQNDNGTWQFFDPAKPNGAVIQIDWAILSNTDKDLSFTYVYTGDPQYNDSITYALNGTTASMALHDEHTGDHTGGAHAADPAADFEVQWDTVTFAGKMTATGQAPLCWDTIANGQVNITCP